jgi:hypothetical protein
MLKLDVLEKVERIVSSWPMWSSYILEYLFCIVPTKIARLTLSAFFGNGVDWELFMRFYELANGKVIVQDL